MECEKLTKSIDRLLVMSADIMMDEIIRSGDVGKALQAREGISETIDKFFLNFGEKVLGKKDVFNLHVPYNSPGEIRNRLQKIDVEMTTPLKQILDTLANQENTFSLESLRIDIDLIGLKAGDIFPVEVAFKGVPYGDFVRKALSLGFEIAPPEVVFYLALDRMDNIPALGYWVAIETDDYTQVMNRVQISAYRDVSFDYKYPPLVRINDDTRCIFQLPSGIDERYALAKKLKKVRRENVKFMESKLREGGFHG
jgi:hypothetical protein